MTMPPGVLRHVAHLGDFLHDVEKGRRPAYPDLERANLWWLTLLYKLRHLPIHEFTPSPVSNGALFDEPVLKDAELYQEPVYDRDHDPTSRPFDDDDT